MTEQMGQRIYVIPLHCPCNFSVRAELFQSEKKIFNADSCVTFPPSWRAQLIGSLEGPRNLHF